MPDNWGFVLAAYLLTATAFAAYWRSLCRRERQLLGGRARRDTPSIQ
jgi:hypothetical protein